MYRILFTLLFSRMDPEEAHHLAFRWIRRVARVPVLRTFVAALLAPRYEELRTEALGLRLHSPFGLAGPKGMDPAIVEKLHLAFKKALSDPRVKEISDRYDFNERYMGPAEYRKFVGEFIEAEKAVLEKLGLAKKE